MNEIKKNDVCQAGNCLHFFYSVYERLLVFYQMPNIEKIR